MSDRVTLAASTGLPFLALSFHVAAGTVALVGGWIAIVARKGGTWHRRAGVVFVAAMIAMGLTAVGISVYAGKAAVAGGALTAYLVFTGWTTIKPLPGAGRRMDIPLMLLAWFFALGGFREAFATLDMPGRTNDAGAPAGIQFFISTIILCAAIGDVRMIWARGIQGTRRLARHLWRMCFGLFIASGSFVAQLVRMTFMPDWTRSLPAILVLSAGPLVVLLYWMWRLRVRQSLRGVMIAKPVEA